MGVGIRRHPPAAHIRFHDLELGRFKLSKDMVGEDA